MRSVFNESRYHLHDRRFWIVQALVLLATAVHLSVDGLEPLRGRAAPDLFIVLMYALFFVPVIYATDRAMTSLTHSWRRPRLSPAFGEVTR